MSPPHINNVLISDEHGGDAPAKIISILSGEHEKLLSVVWGSRVLI